MCDFDSLANGITHQPVIKFGILIEEKEEEDEEQQPPPHLPRYILADACSPESIEIAKSDACLSVAAITSHDHLGTKTCKAISLVRVLVLVLAHGSIEELRRCRVICCFLLRQEAVWSIWEDRNKKNILLVFAHEVPHPPH